MKAIGIIDYGRGNLRSVAKALEAVGAKSRIAGSPRALSACAAMVLPGVGAFGDAMRALRRLGLASFLRKAASEGRPLLGVCLGLQLFCEESSEFGRHEGLGFFSGKVSRFPRILKTPHMGWNQVRFRPAFPLARGLRRSEEFYFVHSYRVRLRDRSAAAGETIYGDDRFDAALWKDNLFAVQFHPEKSQAVGLRIYRNFWNLAQKN